MASYTFKWPHSGSEVYVTGTFDDWSKSTKLEKVGDVFEGKVTLEPAKVLYKFVVDGDWKIDEEAPKEDDGKGIFNNVLTAEEIQSAAPPTAAIMNSAAPESTTAALAGEVPLEKKDEKPSDLPGTFPETPANELGEVSINPMPAAPGAANPITLAPGEKIPETIAADNVNSHVKLDKESYEKADTLPGMSTEVPPVTNNMIPESSLPIAGTNDLTINSVAPGSTTAALAAKVPLEEPQVPEVVKESQEKAGVAPEASGISEEVKEKEQVEQELLTKVPEVPSTSEGTSGKGTEKSETDKTITETVTAAAVGLGAAAVATAVATKDTVVQQASVAAEKLPAPVKEALPTSATTTKEEVRQEVSPEVPAEVKESLKEAGKSPEAAANTEAVVEKKEVEAELLKEMKPAAAVGETPAKPEANGTGAVATKEPETPSKPTETKPAETTPGSSKGPEATPATAEKKKKNRLSAMFGKIKSKIGNKDKA